tara:strand:+ start:1287 stop:1445 length:159 start_codon:yes stop_codon:yes gene_type:complete
MNDKKAAKLIIKRAKKHPELYTKDEIKYAKMVKKRIKQEKKDAERKFKSESK